VVELIRVKARSVVQSGPKPPALLRQELDNPLILLQQQAGNQAVSRLIAGHLLQRCGPTPCECSPEQRAAVVTAGPNVGLDLERTRGAPALQRQGDDGAVDNDSASGDEASSSWMCNQIPINNCTICMPWPMSRTGFRKWCHWQLCGIGPHSGCGPDFCKSYDCVPFESPGKSADDGGTSGESEESADDGGTSGESEESTT
jgi:hypothetical protein